MTLKILKPLKPAKPVKILKGSYSISCSYDSLSYIKERCVEYAKKNNSTLEIGYEDITVEVDYEYGDSYVSAEFPFEKENPKYDSEIKKYESALAEYKEDMKKYKEITGEK